MAFRRSGRDANRFRYSNSVSSSVESTGTFRQMSSGNSANDPTFETRTDLPKPKDRSRVPELSPTVGKRRFKMMSQAERYPTKSSIGVKPMTRTLAASPND